MVIGILDRSFVGDNRAGVHHDSIHGGAVASGNADTIRLEDSRFLRTTLIFDDSSLFFAETAPSSILHSILTKLKYWLQPQLGYLPQSFGATMVQQLCSLINALSQSGLWASHVTSFVHAAVRELLALLSSGSLRSGDAAISQIVTHSSAALQLLVSSESSELCLGLKKGSAGQHALLSASSTSNYSGTYMDLNMHLYVVNPTPLEAALKCNVPALLDLAWSQAELQSLFDLVTFVLSQPSILSEVPDTFAVTIIQAVSAVANHSKFIEFLNRSESQLRIQLLASAASPTSLKPLRCVDMTKLLVSLTSRHREPVSDNSFSVSLKFPLCQVKYFAPNISLDAQETTAKASSAESEPINLVFDAATATRGIQVNDNGKTVIRTGDASRCYVLGSEGFSSGRHRWALKLIKEKRGDEGTFIGVASARIRDDPPDNDQLSSTHCWLYSAYSGRLA